MGYNGSLWSVLVSLWPLSTDHNDGERKKTMQNTRRQIRQTDGDVNFQDQRLDGKDEQTEMSMTEMSNAMER